MKENFNDNGDRRCLIIATHFDDDYLMFGSFLIGYPGEISIVYTHQGDCISENKYNEELIENENFLEALAKYREKKGYGKCEKVYYPQHGEVSRLGVSEKAHFDICEKVEKLLEKYKWEYYLYSCKSIHNNHVQSHMIAESILRDPYIFSVEKVYIGTYDPECMFPVEDAGKFNTQVIISEEDMSELTRIGKKYHKKLEKFTEEQFRKILHYNGLKIKKIYAQSFAPRHQIISFQKSIP